MQKPKKSFKNFRMKILRIIKSRFTKKDQLEPWQKERRIECSKCIFNTLNSPKQPLKVRFMIWLSNLYTFITFNEKTKLGNCSICTCDIFYKTLDNEENCDKNKWKY